MKLPSSEQLSNAAKGIKHKLLAPEPDSRIYYINQLLANRRYEDPKCLTRYGCKIYSQTDEDGIIHEIFQRIGTTNKKFVEFGVGNGLENNTLALLFQGWSGLWIEGSKNYCAAIEQGFTQTVQRGILRVENAFITVENIDEIITRNVKEPEIDLLSVDIDGNDFHVYEAIRSVSPRVIVFEYNAKMGPFIRYCMRYNEQHTWNATDNFGMSLKFLEEKMRARNYALVGCNLFGLNAFFVRCDLLEDKFLAPYTAEQHYETAKYNLGNYSNGHPASYRTLEESILMQENVQSRTTIT